MVSAGQQKRSCFIPSCEFDSGDKQKADKPVATKSAEEEGGVATVPSPVPVAHEDADTKHDINSARRQR